MDPAFGESGAYMGYSESYCSSLLEPTDMFGEFARSDRYIESFGVAEKV